MSDQAPRTIVKGACYVNGVAYAGNVAEDADAVGHVGGGTAYPDDQRSGYIDQHGVERHVTTVRGLALNLAVAGASRDWLGRPCTCLLATEGGDRVTMETGFVVMVDESRGRVLVRATGPFSAPWLAPGELSAV